MPSKKKSRLLFEVPAEAETGDFPNAISTEKEAVALLDNESIKNAYGARLALYESKTPYHFAD